MATIRRVHFHFYELNNDNQVVKTIRYRLSTLSENIIENEAHNELHTVPMSSFL